MPSQYVGIAPQAQGSVAVKWGRDHDQVQISVAGPIGWRDTVPQDTDRDNGFDWHYTANNRHEINNLIRLLQKARNQAFGEDA